MAELISLHVMPEIKKSKSVLHCCVPGCTSDSRYDSSLHFHKIPKDEGMKKQWIIKIRRDEGELFKITKMTVVCSKHFKREDYKSWTPVRKCLKPGAIPSIFNWTEEKPPRRALKRKYAEHADESGDVSSVSQLEALEVPDPSTEVFIATPLLHDDSQIKKLQQELNEQKSENEQLKQQLKLERFGINRFTEDNTLILFYTGFSSYISFVTFFSIIQPSAQNMQSAYYKSSDTISLAGRKRNMLLIDEFFMFFCRLKAGLLEQDLGVRFNCSFPTVSRKIITWANFLYFTLGSMPIWLSREKIQELMPEVFKSLYPRTRVIIDCTELKTQAPSSLVLNSQAYSTYKSSPTVKCLLGIAPHGMVTFVSCLYTGSMSDVEITQLSGLLELLEDGDDVMADKGFTLKKILAKHNVTLNIPDFLSTKRQFSLNEIENTEQIARLRIHIERMNRRIKENHLFDSPIPWSLVGSVTQLWTVACLMANFKGPLVKAWSS